jgi:Skp family chaperone for outer membrane proteins
MTTAWLTSLGVAILTSSSRAEAAELADRIAEISASAASDELDYWGGIKTLAEFKAQFDEDEEGVDDLIEAEGTISIADVDKAEHELAELSDKLEADEISEEEFDDGFLGIWQETLGLG